MTYTFGRIGEHRIVSVKLPELYGDDEVRPQHADCVDNLIGEFQALKRAPPVSAGSGKGISLIFLWDITPLNPTF